VNGLVGSGVRPVDRRARRYRIIGHVNPAWLGGIKGLIEVVENSTSQAGWLLKTPKIPKNYGIFYQEK